MFSLIGRSFTGIRKLFSSNPDEIMTVAKGVGNWIDGQQFTAQEKSTANLKLLEHKLKWIAATQGMNLARRYLAILFAVNFLIAFQICLITTVVGFIFKIDITKLIDSIVDIVIAFQLGWAMVTILVFYFGKGIAESVKNK